MPEINDDKGYDVSNGDFVEEIRKLIADGYGLTPFLGSGCSSPSGIMMGQEFTDYLGYTVYLCVRKEKEEENEERDSGGFRGRWDMERHNWPGRPGEKEIAGARLWIRNQFEKLIVDYGMKARFDAENRVTRYTPRISGKNPRSFASRHSPEQLARLLNAPVVPGFLRAPDLRTDDAAIRAIQEHILGEKEANERIIISRNKSETSYDAICEKAIRSLSDWRATLRFLSMLRTGKGAASGRLGLGEVTTSVIDKFHDHITRDHEPNLTHQMIAQLSMSARIRIVLTTNFDKLIEKSYKDFGRNLLNVPVGLNGGLPHPDLVHAGDRLVKLHGDLHETRADFSLDEPPTQEDKDFFFHYIRGNYPGFSETSAVSRRFIPSQLLIIGYSGSDRRCNDMIKYVLDADQEARIYWICHSKRDLENLHRTFAERDYLGRKGRPARITATQTERPDLLLYDIYQQLNLTLPSPGTTYHFPDRVIPARSAERAEDNDDARRKANEDARRDAAEIGGMLCSSASGQRGSIVVLTGGSGVLTVIHETFEWLRAKYRHRVWLELEDFPDAASVGAEIRTALGVRTGSLALGHVKPLPHLISDDTKPAASEEQERDAWTRFFSESARELRLAPWMWTIGLYGRNGAGGCSGWDSDHITWDEGKYRKLELLIEGMSAAGFNVLYAPYTESRQTRDGDRLVELKALGFGKTKLEVSPHVVIDAHVPTFAAGTFFKYECCYSQSSKQGFSVVLKNLRDHYLDPSESKYFKAKPDIPMETGYGRDSLLEWRDAVRALFSATLFRQSRHFSSFMTEAIYDCPNQFNLVRDDNDARRADLVRTWLRKLNKEGVFYTKPGGFAWAYRDIRLGIRHLIETLPEEGDLYRENGFIHLRNFASRNHFFIGEWYVKAHRITRHTLPLTEGLYHFYQAILHLPHIGKKHRDYEAPQKDQRRLDCTRKGLFFSSAIALLHLLKIGERTLRYWSSVPLRRSMFSQKERKKVIRRIGRIHQKVFAAELAEKSPAGGIKGGLEKFYTVPTPAPPPEDPFWQRFEGIEYHAWTLIDDISRELAYIDQRFTSEFRIADIPFQKDIRGRNYCQYGFGWISQKGRKPHTLSGMLKDRTLLITSHPLAIPEEGFLRKSGFSALMEEIYRWKEEDLATPGGGSPAAFSKQIRAATAEIRARFLFGEGIGGTAYIGTPREINLFIQALVEWAFQFIRRAKKLFRARLTIREGTAHETSAKDFLAATLLCKMALDLCRLLPPAYTEYSVKQQIKAQSLYGLALGNLGRFREAHRRLGEARVLCRSLGTSDPFGDGTVILGIAELRRAEILCLEARECGAVLRWLQDPGAGEADGSTRGGIPEEEQDRCISFDKVYQRFAKLHDFDHMKGHQSGGLDIARAANILKRWECLNEGTPATVAKLNRIIQAKIGDAWRCLEESRRCFGRRTRSPRWWGRQYALELRIFGEVGTAIRHALSNGGGLEWYRMLPCRNRRDLASHLRELWEEGLAVAGTDPDGDRYYRLKITSIYLFSLNLAPEKFSAPGTAAEYRPDDLRLTRADVVTALTDILAFLSEEFPGLREFLAAEAEAEKQRVESGQPPQDILKQRESFLFKDLFPADPDEEDLDRRYYHNIVKAALRLHATVR